MKNQSNIVRSFDSDLSETSNNINTNNSRAMGKFLLKLSLITLSVIVVLALIGYMVVVRPGRVLMASVRELEANTKAVAPYAKTQDLGGVKNQLEKVKGSLTNVETNLHTFKWSSHIPFAKNYYNDGQSGISAGYELIAAAEIGIDAIAPYADVIGLKGLATSGDGGKTAQDRITFIVNTLDKIHPQLDKIGEKLSNAQKFLANIDPNRYPEEIKGIKIRSQLASGLETIDQASTVINDAKPILESAPYLLGNQSPRKYLVLFQNDAEIRGTGGFLTGYAIINVTNGKVQSLESDDIYKLDEKFTKRIPAPEPILKYLPLVPYWYLRDQNLSPDFKSSMETFMSNYKLTKSPEVDGVIAVDTQLLVDLLKVTGPIGVSGLGTFTADQDPRCNCPQVFYELQVLAGGEEPVVWDSVSGKIVKAPANYGNRKAFLGPLMYSVLANVMAQPKSKFPLLFNTAMANIQGKHIMAYFNDPKAQMAVESFNMAGRVRESDSDYLLIVDTNFAGAKTNIWVNYKVDQKVDIDSSGNITKTVTLTYANPQQTAVKITQARNLNGAFRDWLRVYVPKGSQLIEAKGFESGQTTSEDLGKTVFDGFFTLTPGNTRQISFKYKLPTKAQNNTYKILIQKQGGIKTFPYTMTINGKSKLETLVDQDKELSYPY